MSRKPQAQRRQAIKDAKQDKAHWTKQRDKASDPVAKATFQRAINKADKTIKDNK